MHYFKHILFFLLFTLSIVPLKSQTDFYDELLKEEVEVENPVYMPVIGIGTGILNYYGELNNRTSSYLINNNAIRLNVSTFLDNRHYFKGNFFILLNGKLSGQNYFPDHDIKYLNFQSEISSFGINVEYNFEHFIPTKKTLHPFIAFGIELSQFNSKTDFLNSSGEPYQITTEGKDARELTQRDYVYETDMRENLEFGLGPYAQNVLGLPLLGGVNMTISERLYMQLGTTLHILLTDALDHISAKNTEGIIGNNGVDMYTSSYFSFHFDLFSSGETITVKKLVADFEFDQTLYDDQDYDMVLDRADKCPFTPQNVKVDTTGCPIDNDNDGVPNYLDHEQNTPNGAIVNDNGEEMNMDEIMALMAPNDAASREEVKNILKRNLKNMQKAPKSLDNLPAKFDKVDKDEDGNISYDEVLKTIDEFFNNQNDYNTSDIYELRNVFFQQ